MAMSSIIFVEVSIVYKFYEIIGGIMPKSVPVNLKTTKCFAIKALADIWALGQ
jgi:hypothetical protein